ncbi:MAG TPA: RagB/SusD family nutrient uptake outer membrane protein [Chitinophagaceae bacterium]|nr:RagB/SusD family nutrient uptake outer membrane protein [Chitinophagaceae bacterium]
MKNILISILSLCLFSAMGCSDFLKEEDLAEITSDSYYQTVEGYESLINSCYATLRDVYGGSPWVFSAGTDMFVEGRSLQPEGISEYRNLTPQTDEVESFYSTLYKSIQLCNTALYYNDKTVKDSSLSERKGEIEFLRSYYYFLLVQSFGGVSIVENRIDDPILEFKRNSAADVYNFVIKQMKDALELVPESSEEGRVNKRVVRFYLAKVYLTRGYQDFAGSDDFAQAASYADKAINDQPLSLSFKDVFWPGNEDNEGIIFAVQYDQGSIVDPKSDGNQQNYFFGPYMGGEGAIYGYPYRAYALCPTMYLFDLYTQYDSRFKGTFMINFYDRYYDFYDKNDELNELNIQYYYAPRWALNDTTSWRQEDPTHRSNTEIIPYSNKWQASPQTTLDNATPAIRKFDDPKSAFGQRSNTRDIFLARLSEAYLIAAEAYYKEGNLPQATARINAVRKRAALPGHKSDMTVTGGQINIDFILDERARELAGEYHRWFDLKRTGQLVNHTKKYNRDIKNWFDQGINPFQGTDGNLKILRPIPQEALDLNQGDYSQNPGY